MQPQPLFRVLTSPICKKSVRAFRREAGWSDGEPSDRLSAATSPRGKVEWAVLEFDKQRVGIARMELASPQFCCISELIIATKYRSRGWGKLFVRQIEQYCAQQRIQRLLLQPADHLHGFYSSLYFIPDPLVAGFMKKEINPFQKKRLSGLP